MASANKDVRAKYFTNRVIKIWNNLPDEIINSNNMIQFEKRLDKHWENQDIKYDDHLARIFICEVSGKKIY